MQQLYALSIVCFFLIMLSFWTAQHVALCTVQSLALGFMENEGNKKTLLIVIQVAIILSRIVPTKHPKRCVLVMSRMGRRFRGKTPQHSLMLWKDMFPTSSIAGDCNVENSLVVARRSKQE